MARRRLPPRQLLATLLAVCAAGPVLGIDLRGQQPRPENPELALPANLWTEEVTSPFGVVSCQAREGAWAGVQMLETGGNAVDAAVATALALGVARPGSSGLGGQTLMLVVLADGRAVAIDGAGAAPRRSRRDELRVMHATQRFWDYPAATTPGTLAALSLALERYGTKTLAEVLQPAIEIAELGFTMSVLHQVAVAKYPEKMRESQYLCSILLEHCWDAFGLDHRYCMPDLACTLRRLAEAGAGDFYRGAIAAAIEADMIANGGYVRRDDLALVRAVERKPVRARFRGHEVLSFPEPGGGATVVEALNILDTFPESSLRDHSVDRMHILVEAVRLAYADTRLGPKRLPPADAIAEDRANAARRAAQIRSDRALWEHELGGADWAAFPGKGTTQVSVADAYGNAVSLTQTVGRYYGCGGVTPELGFPYSSLMENFDLDRPDSSAFLRPLATPMSTMAPTVVLKDGRPWAILGSGGSSWIPSIVVGTIVNLIDGGMGLCEAVTSPRVVWSGDSARTIHVEVAAPITESDIDALAAHGFPALQWLYFPAAPLDLTYFGDVNAVLIDPQDGTTVGVGDPRRDGVALGATRMIGTRRSPIASLPCWRELLDLR